MFASSKDLNNVKEELDSLKADTALLSERFSAHTTLQAENHANQSNKMDEIIGLIKETNECLAGTATKIHDDIIDRVTREYSSTADVESKIHEMKNCVRREFVTRDTMAITKDEIEKGIKGVRELSENRLIGIRREAYLAVIIASGILGLVVGGLGLLINFYGIT